MRSGFTAVMLVPAILAAGSLWANPVNPFARPAQDTPSPLQSQESVVAEHPMLRGIIFAGPSSIANLNGTLLSIGETFAGYQLQSVDQGSATFLHGDKLVTLYIEEPPEENGE